MRGDMGDFGREKIAASLARRFGNPAAEFAALAVDRQGPVLAPERLKSAGRQTGTAYRAARGRDVF